MAKVTVFPWTKFDIVSGEEVRSEFYGTRRAIKQVGGTVIEEVAIEIEESMLDGNGMYKPTSGAPD